MKTHHYLVTLFVTIGASLISISSAAASDCYGTYINCIDANPTNPSCAISYEKCSGSNKSVCGASAQLNLSKEPTGKELDKQKELGADKIVVETVGLCKSSGAGDWRKHTLVIPTDGHEVLAVDRYVKNSAWPNNCEEYPIVWTLVGDNNRPFGWVFAGTPSVNSERVAVQFGNESHCNRRGGRLVVYLGKKR